MPKISPHAVVDPKASLAEDVEVGPFCVIGPNVSIDRGCRLLNNVTLMGHVSLGRDNICYPNCVLGAPPQDRKYSGAPTRLEIGHNNIFRESVTIHIGTEKGGAITRVGSHNLLMVNAHLGHDVQLGSNNLLANNVMVGGHAIVGDYISMMGAVGIHHFVTVGECTYIGAYSRIHHDVPPFCKVDGADVVRALNSYALRRAGFTDDDIAALEDAHRTLFSREKPLAVAMAEFDLSNGVNPKVRYLLEFLQRRTTARHGRYLETELRTKK